ncbi:FixH family protein [Aliidiomarina soli]|uniref:Nitrogen fixation protein FixH n=1 Tax=Aliidiomarina soli TaxID=1928574 RepID=A0A432WMH4_9GAMM|nr:FixH family protein [Aliidiomarina soli]RUO34964.1 hypothetical protein CWE14_02940 [Aliidiomarina soli]
MQSSIQPSAENTPWYKHFWVWWLIGAKVAVISACFYTGWLIYHNPASMVIDDYYKEGRTINLQLTKVARAEELGIAFDVSISERQLMFRFTEYEPEQRAALHVVMYHPTLDEKDFELRVPHAGEGWYRAELPREISGHWRIIIEPFDEEWRVSDNIHLPQDENFTLTPENYGV